MARQYIKIDNYLLEWVYDTNNALVEPYKILTDGRDGIRSYVGTGLTNNTLDSQLFLIDPIKGRFVRPDTTTYPFLAVSDHSSLGPVVHDRIGLYIPAGQGLGQARGISLELYTLDLENRRRIILSRFYYDILETPVDRVNVLSPPFFYDGRLWDRKISIEIPSPGAVSSQLQGGLPVPGSINDILTGGRGTSLTAPLFVDFRVIAQKQELGQLIQYISLPGRTVSFPREPEFGQLTVFMDESTQGDYFEIYPVFSSSLETWRNFLTGSRSQDKDYVGEYVITLFEENRRGQVIRTSLTRQDMSVPFEYRPIVRTDTVKCVIDVEFRLTDKVSGTTVIKKASYGLLPEQTSKYSLRPKKVNVGDVFRPRIYVRRERTGVEMGESVRGKVVETRVPRPVLTDNRNIHASSKRMLNRKSTRNVDNYHPQGLLRLSIPPFDSIVDITLADFTGGQLEYMDLTSVGVLTMVLGMDGDSVVLDYTSVVGVSDPVTGRLTFSMRSGLYNELRRLWDKNKRLFHIVSENRGIRTVIYTGQYIREDEVTDPDMSELTEVRDVIELPPVLIDQGDGLFIPGGARPGRGSRPESALDPERGLTDTPFAIARRRQVIRDQGTGGA